MKTIVKIFFKSSFSDLISEDLNDIFEDEVKHLGNSLNIEGDPLRIYHFVMTSNAFKHRKKELKSNNSHQISSIWLESAKTDTHIWLTNGREQRVENLKNNNYSQHTLAIKNETLYTMFINDKAMAKPFFNEFYNQMMVNKYNK
jgi:hypothetical protein